MTAREKNLALAVGLCAPLILGYFGWTWYTNAKDSRLARLQAARSQLSLLQAKQQYAKAEAAMREEWKRDSIPENRDAGLNQFQSWLVGIANKHQLADVKASGKFIGETANVFKKFNFTLDGFGTLDQLAKFLEDFARVDRLQAIRSLTIEPEKSGKLKINLTAEALAIAGSNNATLPGETRTSLPPLEAAKGLVSRNFFAEYVPPPIVRRDPPPQPPPPTPPQPPPFDLSQFTYVTAVIENNGEPEVWITHRPWEVNGTKHLRAGETFEFDAVRGKVVSIDIPSQTVDLEIGNRKARVVNGNSLASGGSSKSSAGSFANSSGEGNSGRGPGEGSNGRGFGDGGSSGRPSSGFGGFSKGGSSSTGRDSRGSSSGGNDPRSRFGRPPGGN